MLGKSQLVLHQVEPYEISAFDWQKRPRTGNFILFVMPGTLLPAQSLSPTLGLLASWESLCVSLPYPGDFQGKTKVRVTLTQDTLATEQARKFHNVLPSISCHWVQGAGDSGAGVGEGRRGMSWMV